MKTVSSAHRPQDRFLLPEVQSAEPQFRILWKRRTASRRNWQTLLRICRRFLRGRTSHSATRELQPRSSPHREPASSAKSAASPSQRESFPRGPALHSEPLLRVAYLNPP